MYLEFKRPTHKADPASDRARWLRIAPTFVIAARASASLGQPCLAVAAHQPRLERVPDVHTVGADRAA